MKQPRTFNSNLVPAFIIAVIEIAAFSCLCWLLFSYISEMSVFVKDGMELFFKNNPTGL
jgi:hypothetical protein